MAIIFLSSYRNRKNVINMFLECWRDVEKYLRASFLIFIIVGDFDFGEKVLIFINISSILSLCFVRFWIFFHFGVDFFKSQIKTNFKNRLRHRFLKSNKDSKNLFRNFLRPILRNLISWHPCQKGVILRHEILITRP